ncbi:MAG TPA: hypothetical protein DHV62_05355 [Elusimicrobia bacterium]|jgi:biotin transport system substrate-specific component|nr:hypothetical protein [Elusimicrobiota bacterium]
MATRVWEEAKEIGGREVVSSKWLVKVIGVGSFIIFTALGAYVWIRLPFTPVPLTLQTFFVLLSGAVLGGRLGALSQLGYWVIGGLGLPFFAGGTFGFKALFGPTGGYLLGFILASWIVGWFRSPKVTLGFGVPSGLADKNKTRFRDLFSIFLIADLLLLLLGASWLAVVLHCSIKKAILLGVLPFIPGDLVKIIFATLIYKKFQLRFRQIYPI